MEKRPQPDAAEINSAKESITPGSPLAGYRTLYDCVREIFPDTRPPKLRAWRDMMEKQAVEPDILLFMAVMCGSHFRIISPELQLKDVQEYLYSWLARGDDLHRMRPDVAELIVAAMTPGIRREINLRGQQPGVTNNAYTGRRGTIPQFRGAWVAALIIDTHFTQSGMEATRTRDLVAKLISVLLETEEKRAQHVFNKLYNDAPKDIIAELTQALRTEYGFWISQDGVYGDDLEPPQEQAEKHAEWKSRHKSLQNLFKQNGCDRFCDLVISRIKYDLWKPLWDMHVERIDDDEEGA